jgi:hypothetical protein
VWIGRLEGGDGLRIGSSSLSTCKMFGFDTKSHQSVERSALYVVFQPLDSSSDIYQPKGKTIDSCFENENFNISNVSHKSG